jgi:ribosomal protein S18 acetylase RimI-like enzyme
MIIRKVNAEDAEEYRRLRLAQVQDTPRAFSYTIDEIEKISTSEIASLVTPSEENLVVGHFDNAVLTGVIGLRRDNREKVRHRANVWGVYTAFNARRKGIARKIFAEVLKEAQFSFKASVVTLAADAENTPAIALYRSLGFQAYGRLEK